MTEYDPKRGISVTALAYEYPSGYQIPEHAHGADQLIYATSGIMEISSGQSVWWVPPYFALWIPARASHRIHMLGHVSMRTLYLRRGLADREKLTPAVLHVTPLLREIILEVVNIGRLRARNRYESALRDLLIPQLEKASPIPVFVTLPQESRALGVARIILMNPAESKPMATLCAEVGVSVRTIERVFRREIGISFESWRQQVRLTKAIEWLVSGHSVKETSYRIGYCQPSAFVAMFRRTFGTTPKAWISHLDSKHSRTS